MNWFKVLLLLSLLIAATTSAADTLQYATKNGAIDGYDPVSYFADGKAERGSPDFTAEWNGVTWRYNPDKLIERADLKWLALNAPEKDTED